MLFDSPEGGYSLHALNGVYLKTLNRWVRLDARGNKQGVQAEFSVHEEKLAFNIREDLDEIDYPIIYTSPNEKTIATLDTNKNALIMYTHNLRSEEHTSELQSRENLVCRLLLEKKKKENKT